MKTAPFRLCLHCASHVTVEGVCECRSAGSSLNVVLSEQDNGGAGAAPSVLEEAQTSGLSALVLAPRMLHPCHGEKAPCRQSLRLSLQ